MSTALKFAYLPLVKSIAVMGFKSNNELSDIFLPNVETLGNHALADCKFS
jgi:hypothetical protein